MKRIALLMYLVFSLPLLSQNKPDYSKIDMMLVRSDFKKVIDTCTRILALDSLNSEVYYRLGLAYQNLLSDDKALDCFSTAATISPDNNNYAFTVAKSYFNKGKTGLAKPFLMQLYAADSINWPYAFYLTSIYMAEGKYDESIKIYDRFYRQDMSNYIFTDKLGYAYLRSGDFNSAIEVFNKSLALNPKDINAMKNLAYLYAGTFGAGPAIKLLTKGIDIDSTDMDLYARRGAINFTVSNFVRALGDYLKLLSSGDSTVLNLKRVGIGFAKNNQSSNAIDFLLKAYKKDSTDLDVLSYLGQTYMFLNEPKKSAYYYKSLIDVLTPFGTQLGLDYILLGEVLKSDQQYVESITAYLKSQNFRSDNNIYMIIANLYDEKLKDIPKAIRYYELYLNKIKSSKSKYDNDYSESITKRIESLKKINKSK
jgi:tetratricopeptide (TPR) repeat protein